MATREELLIIARLKNEVSRPVKEIGSDFDRLSAKLRTAEKVTSEETRELRRLGAEMKRTSRDAKDLANRVSDVGSRMSTFLSLPIVAAFGAATLAASNLNEQMSRSRVVFGENAAAVQTWAEGGARAMGLSTRAALQNAAGFGNLFTQMGLGLPQATAMSQTLVELSADIASFNNVSGGAAEVNETFAASFRGEFDSVQRFIPTIRAATVEQRALAMGLADANGEVSDQAKALATYQLLIEGAGAAVGDFNRTQDAAANRMRTAQATIENAGAEIGENLLPALAAAAGAVASLAEAFGDLPESAQNAIIVLGGVAAVVGPIVYVAGKVMLLQAALASTTITAGGTAAAVMALGAFAIPVAIVLASIIAVRTAWQQNERMLTGVARDQLGDLDLNSIAGLEAGITRMRGIEAQLRQSDTGSRWDPTNWADKASMDMSADAAGRATSDLERELREAKRSAREAARALEDAGGEAEESAGHFSLLAESIEQSREAYDRLIGRFTDLEGQRLQQRQAIEQFNSAMFGPGGMTGDAQLEFALSQIEATRKLVEGEQETGELAMGRTAAYERQVELINELIRLFPRLADEFAPTLGRLNSFASLTGLVGSRTKMPVGDRATPVGHQVHGGDSASTYAAHDFISGMVGGSHVVSSLMRNWGLGSPDSDHTTGRAVDVVSSNGPGYAAYVRRMGGIAELHGDGPSRHVHAVPAPIRGGHGVTITIPVHLHAGIGGISRDQIMQVERVLNRVGKDTARRLLEKGVKGTIQRHGT